MIRRYITAIGIFANKRKTEFPESFLSEMSIRKTISSHKSTVTLTIIAKITYINPQTSKYSLLVIKNNKNRNVPRPKEIAKVYFPVELNFIFSM